MEPEVDQAELVRLLEEMIRIPSHKQVSWQEDRLAQFIYEVLTTEGILDLSLDYLQENRPNLYARMHGTGEGRNLLFCGHLDTVPPYNMVIPPFQPFVREGRLYGLGAVDMKGSLAAMLMAMMLVKRSNVSLKGDLIFAGVVDQEQRSIGTVDLVSRGINADHAVVGEPTDLHVGIAHKGMEWMKVIVRGRSAHGSSPEKGGNAIYHAARVACELENLNVELQKRSHSLMGSPSINLGVISGGDDPNTVPNLCFLELDRRWTPEETRESIYKEIREILDRLEAEHAQYQCDLVSMEDRICALGNTPLQMDPESTLVKKLVHAIRVTTGGEPCVGAYRAWSDAALIHRELKIPTVVFGPGCSENAHAADESVIVANLMTAVKVYYSLIIEICG